MEVSPLDIKGESGDEQYGKDTPYAMFEIFSLSFDVGGTTSNTNEQTIKKNGETFKFKLPPAQNVHKSSANDPETRKGKITVSKAIDLSSPDLFRYCCEKKPIDWAIILIREAGEDAGDGLCTDNPWLRLELTKVHVTDFSWDLDPGASGDEANKTEKLVLEFETIMIFYSRQQLLGGHDSAKTNRWNFAKGDASVDPIR